MSWVASTADGKDVPGRLEDAILIRLVPMHTSSERQRQSNPRKAYPVDSGLITAFDRSGKPSTGHALETAVLVELFSQPSISSGLVISDYSHDGKCRAMLQP